MSVTPEEYALGIVKLWKYLKSLSKYRRSFHFAYWIVPTIIVVFWYAVIEGQEIDNFKNKISIIPLNTYVNGDKKVLPKKGMIIITNELKEMCKIPLKGEKSEIWTSLNDTVLKLNDDRIFVSDNNALNLNMPIYGEDQLFGIVVNEESKGELIIPGQSISLSALLPDSPISLTLLLSVFCGVAFGFGLIFKEFSESY